MAKIDQVIPFFKQSLGESSCAVKEFRGETTLEIPKQEIVRAAGWLKNNFAYDYLVDITGIDNLGEEPRFEIVYEFSNFETAESLRIKIKVDEETASVPSLCSVYQGANWHEREIFDLLGIRFEGHPDLRRIIMWEGYPYFPMRKDFPLEGKWSDVPGEAFSQPAPLEGGPFVSRPAPLIQDREPRAHPAP